MLNDGSTLDGYTINIASIKQGGNPGYYIDIAGYIYYDFGESVRDHRSYYFDLKLGESSNIVFMGNNVGIGPRFKFHNNSSTQCFFDPVSTSWGDVSGASSDTILFNSSFEKMVSGQWYSFRIDIDWPNSKLRLMQMNGSSWVEVLGYLKFTPTGNIIGCSCASGNNAGIDNFGFLDLTQISGNAKLSTGDGASSVQFYDWASHQYVASVMPDSSGAYTVNVEQGEYLVVATGPDGYQPVAQHVSAT